MSAVVDVLSPGLQTTVQDQGRWGHQAVGVPVAGPMDPFSHRLANALAGNHRGAATLEVTLVGPALQFQDQRVVAVVGAEFDLFIDDIPAPFEQALAVRAGAVLRFGPRRRGARAYVAVAGGFDVPAVLGSRATHVSTHTGGWQGRALVRGDQLPLGGARAGAVRVRSVLSVRSVWSSDPTTRRGLNTHSHIIRVLAGPQADRFRPEALDALVSAPYHVSVDSDRMGYRLTGPLLRHAVSADIISDATPHGVLQVPGSGQPLLLMADRPTTGGYPKLATVISADIGVAGQAAPGDSLHFRICSGAEAVSALIARERSLIALESAGA